MPSAIFSYNWKKYNLKNNTKKIGVIDTAAPPTSTGFEELPKLNFTTTDNNSELSAANDVVDGCTNGLFLGLKDEYTDCSKICRRTDYSYKFIKANSDDTVLINNKKIFGAYCLPNSIAKCNLNNSHAIIGTKGYTCVSKYSVLFGGDTGDQIIGCKSKRLKDNLLNTIYYNTIPENLFIDDIDEKTETGQYRFECDFDENQIGLPPTIGSRFESELNTCGKFDSSGKIDFVNATCSCDHYTNNNKQMSCTKCTSGWNVQIDRHGSMYGYVLARNCIDPLKVLPTDSMHMPCGLKTLEKMGSDENSVPYCEKALLLATNTYTPMALENIFHEEDEKLTATGKIKQRN